MTYNMNGETLDVIPRASTYIYNNNTCLDLEDSKTHNTLVTLSINLAKLPFGHTAVNDVSYPNATSFLEENELGYATGKHLTRRTQTGFHDYPIYSLDMREVAGITDRKFEIIQETWR